MNHTVPTWTLKDLQTHLQYAVDLELWTIPFYMSAMYSIEDQSHPAYQAIQTVVYQEMLHLQLAANIANAYGTELSIRPPEYVGDKIPHLNFRLDKPDPRHEFHPHSAEIGQLDLARANSMCLIEYPRWAGHHRPELQPKLTEYGSIGEFYRAVQLGMTERVADVRGGRHQVDEFGRFYANLDRLTVDRDGEAGLAQALRLVQVIVDQGEGETRGERDIPTMFQNTADDANAQWAHFGKFRRVRDAVLGAHPPATYAGVAHPPPGSPGARAQDILVHDFAALCALLQALFHGRDPADFGPRMAKVGAAISSCWQSGAIPRFS